MLAGFIDFTLPISHHGERPFKCVTTRWYFQEHKSSGLMSECYPSTFLSGSIWKGLSNVTRALAKTLVS